MAQARRYGGGPARVAAAPFLAGLMVFGAIAPAPAQDAVPRLLNRIEGWFTPDQAKRPAAAPAVPPLPRAKPALATLEAPGLPWQPLPQDKPEAAADDQRSEAPGGVIDGGRETPDLAGLLPPQPKRDWLLPDPAVAFAAPGTAGGGVVTADMLAILSTIEAEPAASDTAPKINLAMVDPGAVPLPRKSPAVDLACQAALTALGVTFERVGRVAEGDCGMATAVRVTEIVTGATRVELSQPAQLDCPTAKALATFVRDTIQPAAAAALREPVTGLRVAASYSCRNRNSQADARLSEHALGNAIDIAAFRTGAGDWITVGDAQNGPAGDAFLANVRLAACGPFKTVLGPGADDFHTDHFHFDLAQRRNGSTYCR